MSESPGGRSPDQGAVEQFTQAAAELVSIEPVTAMWCGLRITRDVSTFSLCGHPRATLAFTMRKFSRFEGQASALFIVLNIDGVRTSEDALRYFLDRS